MIFETVVYFLAMMSNFKSGMEEKEAAKRAKEYSRIKYSLAFASFLIGFAYLIVMIFYGSAGLREISYNITDNIYLQTALYSFFFFLIYNIVNFPIDLYNGFLLERRYNLSTQHFGGWAADEIKKLGLSILFLVFIVQGIYIFLRNFPKYWWVLAGIFWFVVTIVISRIAPEVLLPLFFKKTNIEDEEMRQRFRRFIPGDLFKIKGIYKVDLSRKTRKANAALAGFGSTKQIILSDTLLDNFAAEEIDFVFAHEVAHYVKGHLWKLIIMGLVLATFAFGAAGWALGTLAERFGFEGVSDIAAFPLLCLAIIIVGLVILPLQNFISRLYEKAADAYALVKTGNPDAAISMFSKMGRLNLADESPNKLIEILFYNHPSIARRMRMALKYKRISEEKVHAKSG